jgi:hypothetical protein
MVPDWCKYCIEKLFLVDSDAISVNDDSLSEGYRYSYAYNLQGNRSVI